MRRMILAAATSSLVLAFVPAAAMARQHSHHKRHHARHHARVHRVTHRRFGDVNNPATTPTTGTPSSDAVGTVDSFTNGTLTIKLNNGSSVSGMVTNDTEIECEASSSTVMTDTHRDGGGGDNGGSGSGDNAGQNSGGDQGDQGDDNDQDDQAQQACTTANLTPGASVRGAELKISSAGAVWDKVDLVS
jgi:hypothetical protein